jgi:hypothetical protein
MLDVGLGVRAATASAGRFATYVAVGFLATASALIILVAPTVKNSEGDRYDRQIAWEAQQPPNEFGFRSTAVPFRGRTVTLVQVPGGTTVIDPPPGFDGGQPVGTVRFSPALAEAVDRNPVLRTWFPYRQLPDLPRAAVAGAGEYVAHVGVDASELRTDASGAVSQIRQTVYEREFGYYQWLGFVLFLGAPCIGLLTLSARLSLRPRRQRYAALRLLGMPQARCRLIIGIETGLPVCVGALVAVGVASLLRPRHVIVPIVGRWVFGDDARLGAGAVVAAGLVVGVIGFALGAAAGERRPALGRLRDAVARSNVAGWFGRTAYALGVALLCRAWIAPTPRDQLRFIGVVAVAIGIPAAVAFFASVVARASRMQSAPITWYLAVRRISADARSESRLAGIVALVVFAICVGTPFSRTVTEPNSTWAAEAREAGTDSVLGRSRSLYDAPLKLRGPVPPGTVLARRSVGLWRSDAPSKYPDREALIASCSELEVLVAVRLPDCDGTVQGLLELHESGNSGRRTWELRNVRGDALTTLTTGSPPIRVPYETQLPLPDLLVPPELIPSAAEPFVTDVVVRVEAVETAWETAQGWVTGSSPSHQLENEFDFRSINDTTNNWIVLAFATAASVALFGAVLSAIDDRRSSRDWATLRALGVTVRHLVTIRLVLAAITSTLATIVAIVPALILSAAFLRVNGDSVGSFTPFVLAASGGIATVMLVSFASAVAQARRLARAETHGRDR